MRTDIFVLSALILIIIVILHFYSAYSARFPRNILDFADQNNDRTYKEAERDETVKEISQTTYI